MAEGNGVLAEQLAWQINFQDFEADKLVAIGLLEQPGTVTGMTRHI